MQLTPFIRKPLPFLLAAVLTSACGGGGGGGSKWDLELDSSCLERDGDPGGSWEGDFDL